MDLHCPQIVQLFTPQFFQYFGGGATTERTPLHSNMIAHFDDGQPRGVNEGQQGNETAHTTYWDGCLVSFTQELVCFSWESFNKEFQETLGPAVHAHLSTAQKPLPLRTKVSIWGLCAHLMLLRHGETRRCSTHEEVLGLLGTWQKKTFSQGSYAVVTPPLILKVNPHKRLVRVTFYCEVYNKYGVIQWPIKWN